MVDKESGDSSNLPYVSSTITPTIFPGQVEPDGNAVGGDRQPTDGPLMNIAVYTHRLHETTRRRRRADAVGAPSSYDQSHPSLDVHTTAPTTSALPITTKSEGELTPRTNSGLFPGELETIHEVVYYS